MTNTTDKAMREALAAEGKAIAADHQLRSRDPEKRRPIDRLIEILDALASSAAVPEQADRCATPASPDEMKVYDAITANYRKDATQSAVWAEYVAGMVVAYLGGGVDDKRIKPIAGIIERRLWALAAQPQPAPRPVAPEATSAETVHGAITRVQSRFHGVIRAAVNLIAEVENNHETKAVPLRYTVPWGAVVALKEAIAPHASEAPGTQDGEARTAVMDVEIDDEACRFLLACMAPDPETGECTPLRLMLGEGHSGFGLYVAEAEYPEEGSSLVVAVPHLRPSAPLSEPTAEGVTSDALLDLAEPLRPLLTKPEHWGLVLSYARSVIAALSSPASSAGRPSDDELWDQTLAERDRYHERADELAGAIAKHLGIDIGEHSNLNDPWQNAIDAALASSAAAPGQAGPAARHMTKENGDCPHWCEACRVESLQRAATAQPAPAAEAAPVKAKPMTDSQAKEVLWAEHLRWMEAAGVDTEGMRPTGEWLHHFLTYVRAIERAHGITDSGASE